MYDFFNTIEPVLAAPITEERPWAAFAACRDRDPDLFFPTSAEVERDALRVCAGCSVQMDCLEFAVEAKIRFGVWGGMTEKERRSLHRRIA